MLCVVPLAGPDFHHPDYGVKPFVSVGDETMIEATLGRRRWIRDQLVRPSDIVFVLRDTPHTGEAVERLTALFPGARSVRLSEGTGGALMSALAGVALAANNAPVMVDLVDLAFDAESEVSASIACRGKSDGFIPWFESSDPAYSYLRFEGDRVVETAEKRVISNKASAGVYSFATASHFLQAAAGCLAQAEQYRVRGALFLCPSFNVLIAQGCRIEGGQVSNVRAYSKQFHPVRPQPSQLDRT